MMRDLINFLKRSKSERNGELKERVFVHRESVLTELFKMNHMKAIKNFFISILIIVCLQAVLSDYVHKGK
jgi:sterol O-acyltransferase